MNNIWKNKYAEWLKKFVIRAFTERFYTCADLVIFGLLVTMNSVWVAALALVWILFISPIIVAAKEDLDKNKVKEQDEHSQL